jgi:hypothetical protein
MEYDITYATFWLRAASLSNTFRWRFSIGFALPLLI